MFELLNLEIFFGYVDVLRFFPFLLQLYLKHWLVWYYRRNPEKRYYNFVSIINFSFAFSSFHSNASHCLITCHHCNFISNCPAVHADLYGEWMWHLIPVVSGRFKGTVRPAPKLLMWKENQLKLINYN